MGDQTEPERAPGGNLHIAISNAIVRMLREYTGRGPTKSRTTIRDNVVLVMLEQTLTKGEESLVRKGRADKVLDIRHELQEAMREESMAKVSELTGRKVTAMLSANHVNPDLGAEIFVLDGPPDHNAESKQPPYKRCSPSTPATRQAAPRGDRGAAEVRARGASS